MSFLGKEWLDCVSGPNSGALESQIDRTLCSILDLAEPSGCYVPASMMKIYAVKNAPFGKCEKSWVGDMKMDQPDIGVSIEKNCPLDRLFRLLSGEWTPHVIWVLGTYGPTRYNELQRQVEGISHKVLTERLRLLEAEGVLARQEEKTVPPKVTYSLTDKGTAVHHAIKQMEPIAEQWINGT